MAAPATADLARELAWRDLAPGGDRLVDPLADLTGDQRLDLEAVAWARAAERRGEISSVAEEYEIAVEMASGLARQGLDVDALVAKYESFRAEVDALNRRVDDGLDGQVVRIPGYALPLEFAGIAVKELLLVPYFGACIHVPPPPPNQMVFVTLDEPYVVNELFAPVWITGRMSVKRSTASLAYVDGRASLETGYTLAGTGIEPYER
ncbi:MAG: DUF3299 domain-containing protein [Defluviicoccus sp.]|nr:DUF3299 domain-containing protein [Defluviicoccus sp.]